MLLRTLVSMLLIMGCALPVLAQSTAVTISGFDHPNSVWPTPGDVYVSNIGKELKPGEKDGDGYIARLNPLGQIIEQRFITGLNAPKGMAVVGGVLYVADIDHLAGFDLKTKARVFDLSFEPEQTTLLNDLVIKDHQTLFVSATDIDKVYEVSLATRRYTVLPGAANGPNGLFYDAGRRQLFVAGNGSTGIAGDVGVFSEKDGQAGQVAYRTLVAKAGTLHGIVLLNNSSALVSDWGKSAEKGGTIWRLDLTNATAPAVFLSNLSGPADLGLFGQMLYVPQTTSGTVLIQRLD